MRRSISIKAALIIVIIAGIYFSLPFLFGIAAKRSTLSFINHENQTLGKVIGIHLAVANYHRGWFSSTANLQIEKKNSDGHFDMIQRIPVVIKHGPSYRSNHQYWTGFGMMSSKNLPIANSPYEFSLRENVGFSGEHGTLMFLTKKTEHATIDSVQINSLILQMNSNLRANQFHFQLEGHGLHFQDPEQLISANVDHLQSTLQANYLGDRHWDLTLGIGLEKNQLSAVLPDNASSTVTLHVNQIDLQGMHFDTQKMAGILKEVIELKQATELQQPVKPTAWMALFQQFLTEVIHNDTHADIKGLSLTSPTGQLEGQYSVSFPTLPKNHDYFDVATRNVGAVQIAVPHWLYTDAQTNTTFALNNFQYDNYNNTVFSRHSKMTFGTFDINNAQSTVKKPVMDAAGFLYQGELHGDTSRLSQTMQWQLATLCFSDGCFKQMHGKLELLKMNYNAFRGIADATRKVVQYDPQQSEPMSARWMDLANAYVKLISPDTEIVLEHDMITPEGQMKLLGELSWPALNTTNTATNTAPTVATILDQAVYQLHMLFPSAYVNTFLDEQQAIKNAPINNTATVATPTPTPTPTLSNAVNSAEKNPAEKKPPEFETQVAQFLQYCIAEGYLKKVGDTYVLDLAGNGSAITINGLPWKAQQ